MVGNSINTKSCSAAQLKDLINVKYITSKEIKDKK